MGHGMYRMTRAELAEMHTIIGELRKASKTHAAQADRLQAIYDRCSGDDMRRPMHMKRPMHHKSSMPMEEQDVVTIIALYADEGESYGSIPNVQGSY